MAREAREEKKEKEEDDKDNSSVIKESETPCCNNWGLALSAGIGQWSHHWVLRPPLSAEADTQSDAGQ